MNPDRARIVMLLSLCVAGTANAHHSTTVFDRDKIVEIRGVVVDFKLRNPHSSFVIDGLVFIDGNSQGTDLERWEVESDATAPMRTYGIDADTFKPGDRVTIMAWPHRTPGYRFALASSLTTADGTAFLFRFRGSDRLFSPSLRQAFGTAAPGEPTAVATGSPGLGGISGRWQLPLTGTGTVSALPLNENGMAAWSAYDQKQSPANACEPINVPELFNAPFFLFEVQMDEQRVTLRHEAHDVARTIPLTGAEAAADADGRFGIVSGRIEGEMLVIESRGYRPSQWGLGIATQVLGGGADVPSSEQKRVTERYGVSGDGQTLSVEYTVQDPVYLTEPYTRRVELTRVPDNTPMYPYECDLESAAMWSRNPEDAPLRVGE